LHIDVSRERRAGRTSAVACAGEVADSAVGSGAPIGIASGTGLSGSDSLRVPAATGFALSANGKAHYRWFCEPLMPDFDFVPFNDLEAMRRQVDDDTAAILLEPVQGEAGIFPASPEYLTGLRALCDERGALLIFDEVQTGFGRTGKMFASEHSGVVPDIMTLAKAIGGGIFPNAAIVYRDIPRLVDFVSAHPDFHPTYPGGSDLGCRVSLRVVEQIEERNLCANAAAMGARLRGALEVLQAENPKIIKEVRGLGLMVGLEYIHAGLSQDKRSSSSTTETPSSSSVTPIKSAPYDLKTCRPPM